ncbi:MAG TPA: PBP1A family penicillin-binding protein [Pyrinomonadaceae bacterium]|jgi:penicillin-binding protein 1B
MAIEVTSVHEPRRGPFPRLKRKSRAALKQAGLVEASRRRKIIVRSLLIFVVGFFTLGAAILTYSYNSYSRLVDERLANGYLTSRAGIYAAPRQLRVGQSLSRDGLVALLRRAGYIEKDASDVWSGSFTAQANRVEIRPRKASGHMGPSIVTVSFDGNKRISELNSDSSTLDSYQLEPELLTADGSMKEGKRAALAYADIPPVLARAILSIEDHRFFEHRGVDVWGIARAFMRNAGDNEVGQGGSTITQQLVKNTYLTPERTLSRKYAEAMISLSLERRLSKEDIFALYCNEIYLGQRGAVGVRGVEQAARIYFGKALKDLTLAEAATIAGMIQSPSRYAPDRHPEAAQARRKVVLDAMLREQAISSEEAERAALEPVAVAPAPARDDVLAPYFIDYVNRISEAQLERAAPDNEGSLRIYTTLDPDLQQLAEEAIRHQLERLDHVYKGRNVTPQAALVALDPRTGDVLAMVGGRSYRESQLNRATDALRQPGSVFKPVVYAAALESGLSPVSMYEDAPREFIYAGRATYRPANYGGTYAMRDVMMRTGLVKSLNVVTVDVAMRAGLSRVARTAENLGLPKPEPYPALALGTTEATPLDIAAAYTAFVNNGERVQPRVIARAADATGTEIIGGATRPTQQAIKPTTAYLITDMLADVIDHGTARAARGAVRRTAIAGKTGTSRDGWFVGYTPNLVCAVWIGFDDNKQLGLTGAEAALPAWTEFIKGAVELRPELGGERFERPAGITSVEVDPETGFLAGPACPVRERIAMTIGLAPSMECYAHSEFGDLTATTNGSETYPPMEAVVTPDSASVMASEVSNRRTQPQPLPRSAASEQTLQPPSWRTTRIEKDASGQRTLVNEIRVRGPGQNR